MNTQLLLFLDIGGAEIFVIVLVIIMFFGSKKIPELARGLGKGIKELKNATNDIQQEIRQNAQDITKIKDSVDIKKRVKDLIKDKVSDDKTSSKEKIKPQKETKNDDKKTSTTNTLTENSVKETTDDNITHTISRSSSMPTTQQTENN